MWYDSKAAVAAQVHAAPRHAKFVMEVPGVRCGDGPGDTRTMYAMLVGLARFAGHYLDHNKKAPNAAFVVDTSCGFNAGSLKLVAKSDNRAGIGPNKSVFVNCGLNYAAPAIEYTGPLDGMLKEMDRKRKAAEALSADPPEPTAAEIEARLALARGPRSSSARRAPFVAFGPFGKFPLRAFSV